MAITVAGPRKGAIADINVTPMADVMIVLLIIFMVATPIIASAPVKLPSAVHVTEHEGDRVEIVVHAGGRITAGKDEYWTVESLADFVQMKTSGAKPPTLLVQADRGVAYSEVASVLTACRKAGAFEIALAASRASGR